MAPPPERVVVVGGGLAGSRSVEALRAGGYQGRLTLVGAEPQLPYDRPPLSKAVLSGAVSDTTLRASYADLDVEMLLGRRAVALGDGVLETDCGRLDFDGLVVATGAVPIGLPGGGRTLRTIGDALAMRAAMRPGARIIVVGAGWIGAEVATASAAAGCRVTVVEAGPAPLAGALGVEVGLATLPWYAEAGVDLLLGAPVTAVEPDAVVLAGGQSLPADYVLVGVGVRPDVGWLTGSAVALERGVAVDEHLRSSMPDVYAVGDAAAWSSRRFGRRLSVEHWDDALHAPAVAAANLLGGASVHDPVPYFWSDQFGRTVQYAGHPGGADTFVWRGDPTAGEWAGCWLRDGVLEAVVTVDRPRDLLQARGAIAAGAPMDLGRLIDPAIAIRAATL
ncbi:MAG: NAD(P)/FAD-dependent oxidoreductase [Mycobacteriales bacterium]